MYFYQVTCAIILLVLEPYLQVTHCSICHVGSFSKGPHSRFVFTSLKMLSVFMYIVLKILVCLVLWFMFSTRLCNKLVPL
jgi:hypothetical protein